MIPTWISGLWSKTDGNTATRSSQFDESTEDVSIETKKAGLSSEISNSKDIDISSHSGSNGHSQQNKPAVTMSDIISGVVAINSLSLEELKNCFKCMGMSTDGDRESLSLKLSKLIKQLRTMDNSANLKEPIDLLEEKVNNANIEISLDQYLSMKEMIRNSIADSIADQDLSSSDEEMVEESEASGPSKRICIRDENSTPQNHVVFASPNIPIQDTRRDRWSASKTLQRRDTPHPSQLAKEYSKTQFETNSTTESSLGQTPAASSYSFNAMRNENSRESPLGGASSVSPVGSSILFEKGRASDHRKSLPTGLFLASEKSRSPETNMMEQTPSEPARNFRFDMTREIAQTPASTSSRFGINRDPESDISRTPGGVLSSGVRDGAFPVPAYTPMQPRVEPATPMSYAEPRSPPNTIAKAWETESRPRGTRRASIAWPAATIKRKLDDPDSEYALKRKRQQDSLAQLIAQTLDQMSTSTAKSTEPKERSWMTPSIGRPRASISRGEPPVPTSALEIPPKLGRQAKEPTRSVSTPVVRFKMPDLAQQPQSPPVVEKATLFQTLPAQPAAPRENVKSESAARIVSSTQRLSVTFRFSSPRGGDNKPTPSAEEQAEFRFGEEMQSHLPRRQREKKAGSTAVTKSVNEESKPETQSLATNAQQGSDVTETEKPVSAVFKKLMDMKGKWKCGTCLAKNDDKDDICACCEAKKPGNGSNGTPAASTATPTPSESSKPSMFSFNTTAPTTSTPSTQSNFTFGGGSGSGDVASANAAKSPFTFGQTPATNVDEKKSDGATSLAPVAKPFSFGVTPSSTTSSDAPLTETSSKSLFFGSVTKSSDSEAAPSQSPITSTGFTFGKPVAAESSSETNAKPPVNILFGAKTPVVEESSKIVDEKQQEAKPQVFSFGNTASNATSAPAVSFSFGSQNEKKSSAVEVSKQTDIFGSSAKRTARDTEDDDDVNESTKKPTMLFGGAAPLSVSVDAPPRSEAPKENDSKSPFPTKASSGFGFSSAGNIENPFASPTSVNTSAPSSHVFGARKPDAPPESSTPNPFGAQPAVTPAAGSTAHVFGASSAKSQSNTAGQPNPSPNPFAFGGAVSQQPTTAQVNNSFAGGNGFGNSGVSQGSSGFGSSTSASQGSTGFGSGTNASQSSTGFGSSNTSQNFAGFGNANSGFGSSTSPVNMVSGPNAFSSSGSSSFVNNGQSFGAPNTTPHGINSTSFGGFGNNQNMNTFNQNSQAPFGGSSQPSQNMNNPFAQPSGFNTGPAQNTFSMGNTSAPARKKFTAKRR